MDRITRSKLKTDRFAVEVEHSVEYVAEHKKQVMLYSAVGVAVALLIAGIYYTSEALKSAAAEKAFKAVYDKHSGTTEGTVAASYLGAISTDQGKLADAEKYFKHVADSGDQNYAAMGKLSLAQIQLTTGHTADAEKLLRSLYEKPTMFVSKEQAAIALARAIALSKPAEARKLLEPLRTERPAVSQLAITLLSELPPQ